MKTSKGAFRVAENRRYIPATSQRGEMYIDIIFLYFL